MYITKKENEIVMHGKPGNFLMSREGKGQKPISYHHTTKDCCQDSLLPHKANGQQEKCSAWIAVNGLLS